jgi:hypothetical protein
MEIMFWSLLVEPLLHFSALAIWTIGEQSHSKFKERSSDARAGFVFDKADFHMPLIHSAHAVFRTVLNQTHAHHSAHHSVPLHI